MPTGIITITSPKILLRIALLHSCCGWGASESPSALCIEPGHSSKLVRNAVYARWTFLQANF